jgi:hypothetical protein
MSKQLNPANDAHQWATEWCMLANTKSRKEILDVQWMQSWFQNVIDVAKTEERRRMLGHENAGQHQFHQILLKRKAERTPVDKAMISAIMLLSTQEAYALMSPEQVFDHFVSEHDLIYKAAQ